MKEPQKTTRSSTKFAFNIGYILIAYVLVMITYGMSAKLVTADNFVPVILAVLGAGVSFFGINLARVTTENVYSVKSATNLAASSPEFPEETQLTSPAGTVTVEQQPLEVKDTSVWDTPPKEKE